MKALQYWEYGSASQLKIAEIDKPKAKACEVLIQVHCTSLNSSDSELLKGSPAYVRIWGLTKPRFPVLGSDISGTIVGLGSDVTDFKLGDEVYADNFEQWGGLAEYVCVNKNKVMLKPNDISFEKAAAIPQAAVVALQGLRDKGGLTLGQHVLINGAGGGAGTFAIQLAKLYGATVTAVDTEHKHHMMKDLGADHTVDYTLEDFTRFGIEYDLILDLVAKRSTFDLKRALAPAGRYVLVGGEIKRLLQTLIVGSLVSLFTHKKMGVLAHHQNKTDLDYIMGLVQTGKLKPIIDSTYSLQDGGVAFERLGNGAVIGKVVFNLLWD